MTLSSKESTVAKKRDCWVNCEVVPSVQQIQTRLRQLSGISFPNHAISRKYDAIVITTTVGGLKKQPWWPQFEQWLKEQH